MTAAKIPGIDTINRSLTGAQIKAEKYVFACRYVLNAPGGIDKELLEPEIREKSAAGVRIVSNFEFGTSPKNTIAEGKAHANAFLDSPAGTLGPDWAPCYYSLDTAAKAGAFDNYAHGWADALTPERLGTYADGAVYRALKAAGLITLAWQSMSSSFPGNSNTSGADIIQHSSGTLAGHSCDFNTAVSDYYGGWLLGEDNPMALSPSDLTAINKAVWQTDGSGPNYPWMSDAKTNSQIKGWSAVQDGGTEAHNANIGIQAANATLAGIVKTEAALTATLAALVKNGGSADSAALAALAAQIKAVGDAESAQVAQLQTTINNLLAANAQLKAAALAAAQAEAAGLSK